jgi:hypothetical protein
MLMSILGPATLALLADALRAVAADLDRQREEIMPWHEQPTNPEPEATTIEPTDSNQRLTDEEITAIRAQALDIIRATLTDAPASTAERVASILSRFNARRVSELTAITAPQALQALREAFPAHHGD